MRRMTLSLVLLALLAGIGLANCVRLEQVSNQIARSLTQAQIYGEAGDWARAEELTRKAQADWEDAAFYLYIVLRHDYTDQVTTSFREVLALIRWQETPEYASASQALVTQVIHFSEAEQLNLKNLL